MLLEISWWEFLFYQRFIISPPLLEYIPFKQHPPFEMFLFPLLPIFLRSKFLQKNYSFVQIITSVFSILLIGKRKTRYSFVQIIIPLSTNKTIEKKGSSKDRNIRNTWGNLPGEGRRGKMGKFVKTIRPVSWFATAGNTCTIAADTNNTQRR